MNGPRIFLDTSAISLYLQNTTTHDLEIENAGWLGCSIITVLEYNSFAKLSVNDLKLFKLFLNKVQIVDLAFTNKLLIEKISEIRIKHRIKLPDAIIAASAILNDSILITKDSDFNNIKNLKLLLL